MLPIENPTLPTRKALALKEKPMQLSCTRFNESIDQSLAIAVASYSKRVDQARDMFLAILGHDLRNPLNAIAMRAQLLRDPGDDPTEALESSYQISQSVSVMERMISDLLITRALAWVRACP